MARGGGKEMSVSYTEYLEDVVNVVERRFAHGNKKIISIFSSIL